jgi:hypothetical protein
VAAAAAAAATVGTSSAAGAGVDTLEAAPLQVSGPTVWRVVPLQQSCPVPRKTVGIPTAQLHISVKLAHAPSIPHCHVLCWYRP